MVNLSEFIRFYASFVSPSLCGCLSGLDGPIFPLGSILKIISGFSFVFGGFWFRR